MSDRSLSPGVTRMVGYAAAETSFERSSELLRVLGGLCLNPKRMEREAKRLGPRSRGMSSSGWKHPRRRPTPCTWASTAPACRCGPSEATGRPGKQADGNAKTREVKMVQLWTVQTTEDGWLQHDSDSATYSGAVESAAVRDTDRELPPFAKRVAREMARHGFGQAKRQAALGDAAPWIWSLVFEQFARTIQIVDLFHAKKHLCDVTHEVYGKASDTAAAWTHAHCAELENEQFPKLQAALRVHVGTHLEVKAAIGYFRINNKHRIRRKQFRQQGLVLASGVVESGCKQVIGVRLKRNGRRRSAAGGNTIVALRS